MHKHKKNVGRIMEENETISLSGKICKNFSSTKWDSFCQKCEWPCRRIEKHDKNEIMLCWFVEMFRWKKSLYWLLNNNLLTLLRLNGFSQQAFMKNHNSPKWHLRHWPLNTRSGASHRENYSNIQGEQNTILRHEYVAELHLI